jgi:hypothetical protein
LPKWIKTQGAPFAAFAWQAGYGAFAVSESNVADVRAYIANQAKRHEKKSFQDEYRAFLKRHGVVYDEVFPGRCPGLPWPAPLGLTEFETLYFIAALPEYARKR